MLSSLIAMQNAIRNAMHCCNKITALQWADNWSKILHNKDINSHKKNLKKKHKYFENQF